MTPIAQPNCRSSVIWASRPRPHSTCSRESRLASPLFALFSRVPTTRPLRPPLLARTPQVVILVDTLFVCLTLCACLFMCCVYRRYSRYVAKISREDLQRLTPATCAPTLTGAHDLSAPGLSPIEETSERPYTPTSGTGEDDAEEGGAAPDGYGGVEDLRDRVRAHLQRCSGLSPSRARGIAGSVATYASI